MTPLFSTRRAVASDAAAIADVYLRSRHAAVPEIPPLVHDDDDVRSWLASVVLPSLDVWVATRSNVEPSDDRSAAAGSQGDGATGDGSPLERIVGMLVLDGLELDQLYLDPSANGLGIGSQLVEVAKQQCPEGLELWTFVTNVGARRFYERHGFVEIGRSAENEEGEMAIRYAWTPAA